MGLWLDRDDLYERIDGRVHTMVEAGYVDEVASLLRSVPRDAKPMQSLGYRHLCAHLLNGLPLEEAIRMTQRDTRRFARKQRTWRNTLGYEATTEAWAEAGGRAAKEAFERPFRQGSG